MLGYQVCLYTMQCTYIAEDIILCYKWQCSHNIIVIQTGHVVSPSFRFLASSGEWIWMQMEGTVICGSDKTTKQSYIECKAVILGYDCAYRVTTNTAADVVCNHCTNTFAIKSVKDVVDFE